MLKYFSQKEFACKCGCGDYKMDEETVLKLDRLRALWGKPLIVSSAKRCPSHNKRAGGAINSFHLYGAAIDLITGPDQHSLIKLAINVGFMGIGVAKGFIHIDTRLNRTDWTY